MVEEEIKALIIEVFNESKTNTMTFNDNDKLRCPKNAKELATLIMLDFHIGLTDQTIIEALEILLEYYKIKRHG